MSRNKVLDRESVLAERAKLRDARAKLVFTNGCFDILHPGHVRYLNQACGLGDRLVVAVNADATVSALKGEGRPLMPLGERMEILAALEAVDYVVSFDEETPQAIIDAIIPDVLVKGGDWTPDNIVGRHTVESSGGKVFSLPFAPGYSTSGLIDRIVFKKA